MRGSNPRPGIDDFVTLMSGAAGSMSGLYDELKLAMRSRMEELLGTLDYVPRSEFEALQDVAAKLSARVDALEAQRGAGAPAAKAKSASKSPESKPKAAAKPRAPAKQKAKPQES